MKRINCIQSKKGSVTFFMNEHTLIALAEGYISPDLIKQDIAFLKRHVLKHPYELDYIADISCVKSVHPFNLFYLFQIKKISNLNSYNIIHSGGLKDKIIFRILKSILRINKVNTICKI